MITQDTFSAWAARATKELKGKPLEKLNWMSASGLTMQPYYSAEESQRRYPVRQTRSQDDWDVFESIKVYSVKEANTRAHQALNGGASALQFVWNEPDPELLPDLLRGIGLPFIQCGFIIPLGQFFPLAKALEAWINQENYSAHACQGYFSVDLSDSDSGTALVRNMEALFAAQKELQDILPGFRNNGIDGAVFGNAGMPAHIELALCLAWQQHALELGIVKKQCQINLSCGGEFYSELCKFRIAGHLSSLVGYKYGQYETPYLMGITTETYLSDLDRYSNLLRLCTSAMSAVMGGATGLLLREFSRNKEDAPDFVARVTRNCQLVLQHETGIGKVNDPAAGAYFFEEMSFMLAEQTWDYFLFIQQKGGLLSYLGSSDFDAALKAARNNSMEGVSSGKRFFLGVNQYPSNLEKTPGLPGYEPGYLKSLHLSRIFHELKTKGPAKKALLIKFGDPALANARAGFVMNFLRCGNWEPEVLDWPAETLPKSDLIVFCAADENYPELVAQFKGNAIPFCIAGSQGDKEEFFRKAGVSEFIHLRSHLFNTLLDLEGLVND